MANYEPWLDYRRLVPDADEATVRLSGEFVAKNDEERFVLGPVFVLNTVDRGGGVVSEANVREVAHKFAEEYQNVDILHTFENVAKLSETSLTPTDLTFDATTVPEGNWMLGVEVEDEM